MKGFHMKRFVRGFAAVVLLAASAMAASAAMAEDAVLSKLWSDLSAQDQAVLEVAAAKANNWITTTKGSPNDKLWSELETRGYLQHMSLAEHYGENAAPAMEAAGFKAFSVTWKGAKELPDILKDMGKH